MLILTLAVAPGYAVLFDSYEGRVGWANFFLAAQFALLSYACFKPAKELRGRWRWAIASGALSMSILTAGRGYYGAFTDLYPHFLTPHPWNILAMLWANPTMVMINVAVLVAWREEAEQQLRNLIVTDVLTGIHNRRGWYEQVSQLIAQANRHNQPVALLMIDLDHFKQLNDTHGHATGDAALELVGKALSARHRAADVVARLGGEEFAVLLYMADADAAKNFDQRLRQWLITESVKVLPCALNFSTGLALLNRPNETLEELMARADAALYRAKHNGRGRLEMAS
jgi:diguanylate cyclase (GGDEF)-like protein